MNQDFNNDAVFDLLKHHKTVKNVDESTLQHFSGILPEILLEEWKKRGFSAYMKGLLQTVDPNEFYNVIGDWDSEPLKCHLIFISAFGDFYYLKDGIIFCQGVHQKLRTNLQNNLRLIIKFSFLKESYQENVLHATLYKEAVLKLGILEVDEIFAFFPAIALGGNYEIEYVRKVKMKEHLNFLSQL